MGVKIAHCADLHIGRECGGNSKKSYFRSKNTFLKILDECKKENVDYLLVAGDLFDDVKVSNEDIKEIKSAIGKYEFKIVVSPGNHDPFTPDSPYADTWPENVFIFKEKEITYIENSKLNVRVWGAAFKNIYEKTGLMNFIAPPDNNYINICVMHGGISGLDSDLYNPIKISNLSCCNMDYVALGHIHKRSEILKSGNTFYAYCGCAQGLGFDETGEKGIYIGEISKGKCDLRFKKTCSAIYEKISVDVSSCENNIDVSNIVLEKLQITYGEFYYENFYKINLTGMPEENFVPDVAYLESILNDRVSFAQISDTTSPRINFENLEYKNDFKSLFIKKSVEKIKNAANEEEKKINENALKIGIRAFSGDVKYNDN